MGLPIWPDEHGKRRPTRPCPKCGLPDPVLRLRYEHLLANGWKPFKPFFMVNWCGRGHEYQPWLQPDGYWLLVSLWEPGEEAAR